MTVSHKTNLRVPRENRTRLEHPPLSRFREAISGRDGSTTPERNIQGRPLHQLQIAARTTVLQLAAVQTEEMTGETVATASESVPLIVSGHQPDLFHPGVWVKNFALHGLANACGGIGLNLIVDNDTLSSRTLKVPAGDREQPSTVAIPFDASGANCAWEDAVVRDRTVWDTWTDQVLDQMQQWDIDPLLASLRSTLYDPDLAGESLSRIFPTARRRLEGQWGVHNLEVSLSKVCETEPFLWFASHVLAQLPRFQQVHNTAIAEYREVNKVRSVTHPVPELQRIGDWYEAPFWMWKTGQCTRQRVFARQIPGELLLSSEAGGSPFARLKLNPEQDACCAVEALAELPAKGIRFRSRALTTTLFSRLFLADRFIHGIGGAKYDEMTNRILERFFELTPAPFLTLSATLYLPLGAPFAESAADLQRLDERERDIESNPDRHIDSKSSEAVDRLVHQKEKLIDEQRAASNRSGLTRSERRAHSRQNYERFQSFRANRRELLGYAEPQLEELRDQQVKVQSHLDANAILRNREFSFSLYPEETIREFMLATCDLQ